MTLHEEIISILKERNSTMNTNQIAEEVNNRNNYFKGDGSSISAFQIHGRTKNYPHLFLRNKTLVGLVGRDEEIMNKIMVEDLVENYPAQNPIINSMFNHSSLHFMNDDVTNIDFLTRSGFEELGSFQTLIKEGLPKDIKLKSPGLYAVTLPGNYIYNLLDEQAISKNNNVVNPWETEKLNNKWISNVDVIYYGLAGSNSPRSLKSRLQDFIDHASGKTTDRGPHRGGEIIFQLCDWEMFSVWFLPTGNPPEPRNLEKELLERFFEMKSKLPFGNRKF
ncbi:MAG: hypothetical protein FD143_2119 [Ignavibacteria bacterium]|nr:MAG: hypothetical protein FD143_2119 [Ignavibacteria bacterium]KAF0158927.1 MAG: hypothetical protein FD188_2409 [Ignavibacteria bacterium]